VRAGKLEAITTMRSNDVILGLPYDIFLFTMLQEMMAVELELELGVYHHIVGSLHIYESDLDWSKEIVEANPTIVESMPRMLTVAGIDALLEGERQTRDPSTTEASHGLADGYWLALLDVLRYCNGLRVGESVAALPTSASPLYRKLIELRGVRGTYPVI
jgi:thymidylate synthase